jgi:hypothetical protein
MAARREIDAIAMSHEFEIMKMFGDWQEKANSKSLNLYDDTGES